MHFKAPLIAALAGLSTALPTASHQSKTSRSSPVLSTSKGFNVRLSVTDPSNNSGLDVSGQYLSETRVGAGSYISVLSNAPGQAFYLNGTEPGTGTATQDIVGVYPIGISIADAETFDVLYPEEHDVGENINGESLFTISEGDNSVLVGAGDATGGQFAACEREFVFYGEKTTILTLRYVYGDEIVPADCAPVELGLECATLEDLPADAAWDHATAQEVSCLVY
ncbi:hypothetical protein GGR57DRAFT_482997 [Xylariaceae sp. FL1272]|nr:hypothetical protein GGR57DRAFT_482997 [Xylariaceae sp. FL1272]